MSETIEKLVRDHRLLEAITACYNTSPNQPALGKLLELACFGEYDSRRCDVENMNSSVPNTTIAAATDGLAVVPPAPLSPDVQEISTSCTTKTSSTGGSHVQRVMLLCNWTDSKSLCDTWNKMSKGNYTWNRVQIVWEEPADWYVIVNAPPAGVALPDMQRVVLFQMEPNMRAHPERWGASWASPPTNVFKFLCTHDVAYNNNEWHLSKTYNQLSTEPVFKDPSLGAVVSTVLSSKYADPGHRKRVDFAKFIDSQCANNQGKSGICRLDVFGSNSLHAWTNYRGSPPYHQKDDAMFPYKYVFNAENHSIPNYYTEKIIDAILAECLIFYWGCPNVSTYIDSRAFVQLDLNDFQHDYEVMCRAMAEHWWEKRLPYIQEAKRKILNELQFFPRLERILSE